MNTAANDTAPEEPATVPPTVRICARCDRDTREPVLVAEVHGNSGPGWNVYACLPCAPSFPKQIDPFTLLDTADRVRRGKGGQEGAQ